MRIRSILALVAAAGLFASVQTSLLPISGVEAAKQFCRTAEIDAERGGPGTETFCTDKKEDTVTVTCGGAFTGSPCGETRTLDKPNKFTKVQRDICKDEPETNSCEKVKSD